MVSASALSGSISRSKGFRKNPYFFNFWSNFSISRSIFMVCSFVNARGWRFSSFGIGKTGNLLRFWNRKSSAVGEFILSAFFLWSQQRKRSSFTSKPSANRDSGRTVKTSVGRFRDSKKIHSFLDFYFGAETPICCQIFCHLAAPGILA